MAAVLAPSAFAANRGSLAAGLTYSVEYSGTYTDRAADSGGYHVWDTTLSWDEVLRASVSASGKVSAQPVKLTLSGTRTTENNLSTGATPPITCDLVPGAPIAAGGFINIVPRARPKPNSPLASYDRFEAFANMPLGLSGEVAYGPGSSPSCMSPVDLAPMLASVGASLPATWAVVASSQAMGTPDSPIRKNLSTGSFDLTVGGETETVLASAVLTASVNRPCPNAADDQVRKMLEAVEGVPVGVDGLPDTAGLRAAQRQLLAAVNAALPRTRAAEREALDRNVPAFKITIRKVYEQQSSELAADEKRWLARAQCVPTKAAIKEQFALARGYLKDEYSKNGRYPQLLAKAIKDQCGCGGVIKHSADVVPGPATSPSSRRRLELSASSPGLGWR